MQSRFMLGVGAGVLGLAMFSAGSPRAHGQFVADRPVEKRAATGRAVALRAGRLFDSGSGRMLTNQAVLVRGERIAEVGPADQVKVPAGAELIDLGRAMLPPGLIDAHSHLFLTGKSGGRYDEQLLKESWQYRTLEVVVNAKKDLEAGFTTMRDLETEGEMYSDVDVRNAINHGLDLDDAALAKMVEKGSYLLLTHYVYEFEPEEDLKASGGVTSRARIHEARFRRALARGVKIAFGTDVGPFPHGTQAKEFESMVRLGMAGPRGFDPTGQIRRPHCGLRRPARGHRRARTGEICDEGRGGGAERFEMRRSRECPRYCAA